MGLYGNLAAYRTITTLVQKLRLHSFVFVAAILERILKRSSERALNLGITGAFWNTLIWIASIVPVMREWFPLNRLQLFYNRPDRPDGT